MSLEKSKYAAKSAKPKKAKDVNPWKEILVSESNLIMALEYAMTMSTQLKKSEEIERVIVGEPVAGVYPLSVAIRKKGG